MRQSARNRRSNLLVDWHWRAPVPTSIVAAILDSVNGMSWLRAIFVWWQRATPGTLLLTWLSGHFVGEDKFGNRYYQNRAALRRWVIYNGTVEASRVPAEWHGWLHHTFREPPTVAPQRVRPWEKEHVPNLTGTDMAYRPPGSLAASGQRAPATGDYGAWKPE
jgi:NADH:ubiquinone oxidoreductase subunit